MGLTTRNIALISTAVVAAFGVGYLIYFDQKRRSDPDFKKRLKRERKKTAKKEKVAKEKELVTVEELCESVLEEVSKENFPESAEEKEKYFMEQVGIGEELCKNGEAYYDQSVIHFYKALKIYPSPLDLIMIYQKTVPEKVFRIVVTLMAKEQQQRQTGFYKYFPPAETKLKLKEGEDKTHQLVADDDFAQDTVIYTETPLVSALHPQLEGTHCNYCMKKLQDDSIIECSNCTLIKFCSDQCKEKGNSKYHDYLCTNNKLDTQAKKAVGFLELAKEKNLIYPQMIAQFLSSMVDEENEKNKLGKEASPYSQWDHIDRMKSDEVAPSTESTEEANLIKEVLATKVPGIDTFLTDEIYLLLKGKLNTNTFAVSTTEEVSENTFSEPIRKIGEQNTLGASLYKITSYVESSDDEPNIKLEFDNGTNLVKAIALKDIKKDDVIKATYAQ